MAGGLSAKDDDVKLRKNVFIQVLLGSETGGRVSFLGISSGDDVFFLSFLVGFDFFCCIGGWPDVSLLFSS